MSDDQKLTILGHIRELRTRLIRSVIVLTITTIVSFVFTKQLFDILVWPAQGINLIFIEVTEMLGTYMRVSLVGGIVLAMPYLVYELIMFVSPALTPREKTYVYIILPWIAIMFAGGVVFGYFVLVPPALKFLIGFGTDIATPQIRIGNYISIVTRLLLAIGIVFELPVISTFLARLGVINAKWLASKRKLAIVFAFVIAAMLTPTLDPINQSLVAVPLVILYEVSIWLAKLVERRQRRQVSVASTVTPPE